MEVEIVSSFLNEIKNGKGWSFVFVNGLHDGSERERRRG